MTPSDELAAKVREAAMLCCDRLGEIVVCDMNRLRACEQFVECIDPAIRPLFDAQQAEVNRLRKALKKITKGSYEEYACAIAQDALEQQEEK